MIKEKIQKLRSEKGVSQQELADAVGVSRQTVRRWESGENEPSASAIKPLCDYFGISPNEFLEGESDEGKLRAFQPMDEEQAKKLWLRSKWAGLALLILGFLVTLTGALTRVLVNDYGQVKYWLPVTLFVATFVYYFAMLLLEKRLRKRHDQR